MSIVLYSTVLHLLPYCSLHPSFPSFHLYTVLHHLRFTATSCTTTAVFNSIAQNIRLEEKMFKISTPEY